MGVGIAHVFALAGYNVSLNDNSAAVLEAALPLIASNLERQVARGKIPEAEGKSALGRITTVSELSKLGPCDLRASNIA
jgi:3-hydroxybutyryl-CoA dehydrogenase